MIQIEDGQNKKKSENNRLTHREKMPKRQTAKNTLNTKLVKRILHSNRVCCSFFFCVYWQFGWGSSRSWCHDHRMCFTIFARIWIIVCVFCVCSIGNVYLVFFLFFFVLFFNAWLICYCTCMKYTSKMTDIEGPMLNSFHWQNKYL